MSDHEGLEFSKEQAEAALKNSEGDDWSLDDYGPTVLVFVDGMLLEDSIMHEDIADAREQVRKARAYGEEAFLYKHDG